MMMTEAEIVEMATRAATKATIATWERQWQITQKERRDSRLWNTKLLLKHYRTLKDYCAKAIYDHKSAQESQSPLEILESLGVCDRTTYIEAIKGSVGKTQMIMAHVERMIQVYQSYCQTSGKEEDKRRFRILQAAYLNEGVRKMEDICEMESIDRSTYFRDIKECVEMLSALIFGADGLAAVRQR